MKPLTDTDIENILARYKDSAPVSVGKLADELGLTVVRTTDLPTGMSGSISKEGDEYFVYVNGAQPLRRQRFTIAHEIGHFVKHRQYLDQTDEILNPTKKELTMSLPRRNQPSVTLPDTEEKQREIEADDFAGELLMPEAKFREIWSKAQSLKDVADYFGVSGMAANVRAALLRLGYFDENGTAS